MSKNIHAVVTFQHISNLPRDVTVNTFSFNWDGPGEPGDADYEDLFFSLRTFYNEAHSTGLRIASYLSQRISRTSGDARIAFYPIPNPARDRPLWESPWWLESAGGGDTLPFEVAVCASFEGDRIVSMPQNRRRGRVFLGPLNTNALTRTATTAVTSTGFMTTIVEAMELLYDSTTGGESNWVWCVWSRAANMLVPVTNGWVNNEPDTQRRRQVRPTSRLTWSASA